MWTTRYFTPRYWTSRFWAKIGNTSLQLLKLDVRCSDTSANSVTLGDQTT